MYQPEVGSHVWYAEGPRVILPARVERVVDADNGVLDLAVLNGIEARTGNPATENKFGERIVGPPEIRIGVVGDDAFEVAHDAVSYDAEGEAGTWHEP